MNLLGEKKIPSGEIIRLVNLCYMWMFFTTGTPPTMLASSNTHDMTVVKPSNGAFELRLYDCFGIHFGPYMMRCSVRGKTKSFRVGNGSNLRTRSKDVRYSTNIYVRTFRDVLAVKVQKQAIKVYGMLKELSMDKNRIHYMYLPENKLMYVER